MSTVAIVYIGVGDEVLVPALDAILTFGEPFDAPADIAGVQPGPWHPWTADDPEQWLRREVDGVREVHDPGHGLLAQVDVWQPAGSPRVAEALQERAAIRKAQDDFARAEAKAAKAATVTPAPAAEPDQEV